MLLLQEGKIVRSTCALYTLPGKARIKNAAGKRDGGEARRGLSTRIEWDHEIHETGFVGFLVSAARS